MKVVILAGGLGTRISEETHLRPKPMVEVGGRPILWHIMKIYSSHGVNDFINLYFDAVIVDLKANKDILIADKVKLSLQLLETDSCNDLQKLIHLLSVVETWIPGLAKKYQDYFVKIIDPDILDILN